MLAKNNVELAGFCGLQQFGDFFGLVLQIAIHHDHPFAGGVFEAGDGVMLAEIPARRMPLQRGSAAAICSMRCQEPSGLGIFHHDDFKVGGDGFEGGDEGVGKVHRGKIPLCRPG